MCNWNTGDSMKKFLALAVIFAISTSAYAYSDSTFVTTEFKKMTCQLSGHGITDMTHGFFTIGNNVKRSTGEHISKLLSVMVLASWDPNYSPGGPKLITEMADRITALSSYAGKMIYENVKIDGLPDTTPVTIADSSKQTESKLTAHFKRTGTNTGNLAIEYRNYNDAEQVLKFSGECSMVDSK